MNIKTQEDHYSKLIELFNNNLNNLFLIIAPPRSGSTLIEKVLSGSENIYADIHEPFMEFGRREGDLHKAYEEIYSQLNKSSDKSSNILIKEMSHDMIKQDIFKKLIRLTNNLVIFNIRDPLLCAESRIRSMLKASPIALKESTKEFILNKLKKRLKKSEYSNRELLDAYAKIMNYKNWEDYIDYFIKKKDYIEFEDFLVSDKERFMTGFGWEEMIEIENYTKDKKIKYIIIDNTDFRNNPKRYARYLCKLWGIKYKEDMLTWKKGSYNHIGKIWYASINDSIFIKHPTETKINIDKFPFPVQKYLKDIALPIYKKLYEKRLK